MSTTMSSPAPKLWFRRRRHRSRAWRWIDWFLGELRPPVTRGIGALGALLFSFALFGCDREPAEIKVKMPRDSIQSVRMDPIPPPFEKKGDTVQLRASAFDKDGVYMGPATVTWTTSDASVATVSPDGLVTINSSGNVEIKATGSAYKAKLEASLPLRAVIIEQVRIVPPEGPDGNKLHLGEVKQYRAEVLDDRGNIIPDAKVRWRTSDYAATVTPTGEVEGRAMGDTQLVAEAGSKNTRFELLVLDWKK